MKIDFVVKKENNLNLYYIICYINNNLQFFDSNIAFMLKINFEDYKKTLLENGGTYYFVYNHIYFRNEKDAVKAVDKLESIVLINKFIDKELIWTEN